MPGNDSDSGHILVNKRNTALMLMKQNLTLFLQKKLPDSSPEEVTWSPELLRAHLTDG